MNRCPDCPNVNACIPSDGPEVRGGCLFILEAPGKEENRRGRMAVGKVGQEMDNNYLPLLGMRREGVRLTNSIKCLPPATDGKLDIKSDKDMKVLESCINYHLYPEIERLRPKLLVLMGAFACRAIDPDINLEMQHGIPIETAWGTAFPMYHPAGAIHEPKKMLHIRTDFIRLRKYLQNKLNIPFDEYPDPIYRHLDDPDEIESTLIGYERRPLACDTETTRARRPFCLTYSVEPGTGYLIRSDDGPSLAAFQRQLDRRRGHNLFHNWLFDGRVVKQMGLQFRHKQIRDTMLKIFHLGNLPQGLKAVSYRELGMVMQDFDDLVTPHSIPKVIDYYRQAYSEEWGKPDEELVTNPDGTFKLYKPQGFNTKLKRFFTDYAKKPDTKDVFVAWTKNWEALQEMVEGRLGPWPGKCVTHAPFEEVISYACRDADATLRLWPILKAMEKQVRKTVQENWRDAA